MCFVLFVCVSFRLHVFRFRVLSFCFANNSVRFGSVRFDSIRYDYFQFGSVRVASFDFVLFCFDFTCGLVVSFRFVPFRGRGKQLPESQSWRRRFGACFMLMMPGSFRNHPSS